MMDAATRLHEPLPRMMAWQCKICLFLAVFPHFLVLSQCGATRAGPCQAPARRMETRVLTPLMQLLIAHPNHSHDENVCQLPFLSTARQGAQPQVLNIKLLKILFFIAE
ncbi:hypothetical protein ACM0P6_08530 [Komagataeibacter sucrofermentans]|uniref:hypothetical protein n=1 Tax=Komagataeibacter sucrofermentans TaxID=1053551 RepID=UPI0011B7155C|nr:hypothetical protein [Komagataeibacter sucrofermentans]